MGRAYDVVCERCGKRIQLAWGMSYIFGWGNPELIQRVRSGKCGDEAKEAYESHDNALCYLENRPFVCRCGLLGAYESLIVMDCNLSDPEILFQSEHRCPICYKRMRPLRDMDRIRCPDCKEVMLFDPYSETMVD